MNLREFLNEEKNIILSWLNNTEETEEIVQLVSFQWKNYLIEWKGDGQFCVNHSVTFDTHEDALDHIIDRELSRLA